MNRITRQYRRDIDGIRAIAVLAVLLFHVFPSLLPGGFVGVDIFFVISGFLISGHIFEAIEAGSFSLLDFYVKRIRRIFPSLLTVLLVCIAVGWFVLFTPEYEELGKLTTAGAFFVSNIVLWKTTGYFNTSANDQILLHLWSLGVEEQYYIIWPLILLIFRKKLRAIMGIIILLAAASFLLNVALVHVRPTPDFYLPITRFWELLIGVILAHLNLYDHGRQEQLLGRFFLVQSQSLPDIYSFLGCLLLIISFGVLNKNMHFPGWWALLPTMGTFFLIAAGPESWINRKMLSHPIPVFVGLISYPLYLWHWPLLVYVRLLSDGQPTVYVVAAVLPVAFFFAWLTYRYIERPLRFGTFFSQVPSARVAVVLLSAMVVTGMCGEFISHFGIYLSSRFQGAGYGAQLSQLQEISLGCKEKFPFATDFCRMSDESKPPTVMLLGDSHAIHFYSAMRQYFDKRGENLLGLGEGDCPPFEGVNVVVSQQAKNCPKMVDAALDFALRSTSVQTIVLSAFSVFDVTGYNFADEAGDRKYLQDQEDRSEKRNEVIFRRGLQRTAERVLTAHKRLYFVMDTPELDFNPISCAVHRPLDLKEAGLREPCGMSRDVIAARQESTRKIIEDVLKQMPGVIVLDPIPILCHDRFCLAGRNGTAYYLDRNHLNLAGATYLVERFAW